MGKCLGWAKREKKEGKNCRPLEEKMGLTTYDSFP
jgi:hypothetical protein